MARQRITEDFVRQHKALVERTGNNPYNVRRALDRDSTLSISIRELDRIWHIVESHRKHSKFRFIVQTDPGFFNAIDDYKRRWKGTIFDLWDWEDVKEGRETTSAFFERLLAEQPDAPAEPKRREEDDDEWDFDPDKHSAADHFYSIGSSGNRVGDFGGS